MNDVDYEYFYKKIDRKFWETINKNRLVEDERTRSEVLYPLYTRLTSHEYFPGIPTTLMEQNKGEGVVRQIPIFSPEDYCIYYFCVKHFEKILSKRRVDGTFGGWSMGGRIRRMEEGLPQDDEGYQLTFSYNPVAWARYYGEFNGRLSAAIDELKNAKLNEYVVIEFDIANYYDSIRLDILEKKIRHDSDYKESQILNLLIYFLNHCNRPLTKYDRRTVGLPQDAFGDCSRLLANYYLQDYDQYVFDLCRKNKCHYFRFADDQIIFAPNKEVAQKILQESSRKLYTIGLNINQRKVKLRKLDELSEYRSFKIFDLFKEPEDLKDKSKVRKFADLTFEVLDDKSERVKDRGYPLLKRLITSDFNLLTTDKKAKFYGYIFDKDFLYSCRSYTFIKLYNQLDSSGKNLLLDILINMCRTGGHSSFHYELWDFYGKCELERDFIADRIRKLAKEAIVS